MRTDAIKSSVHFFNALLQAAREASLLNKHAKGEAKGVFQKLLHEAFDFGISCRQKRCFQNMHPYTSPISSPDPQNRCVLGSDGGEISLGYSRHKRMVPFRGIMRNIVLLLVYMEWDYWGSHVEDLKKVLFRRQAARRKS